MNTSNSPKNKFKILQINLNRCRMAQDLLNQTAAQLGADIVIISEPWSPCSHWHNDGFKDASIWIPMYTIGAFNSIKKSFKSKGIVAVQLGDFTVVSCYFSPNITLVHYKDRITELESLLEKIDTERCIIAGDLNAKSPLWGSGMLDDRGGVVMEMINNHSIIPTCSQGAYTFERNGHRHL
ncbi:uncharacterized protein LOC143219861 [Lasioglossum baleicum]|uniref:uncharacterized protein LOC143219861 n=2 Tax=Lasioglossum baleicum TaxID=434251 RepID=UPI003FCD93BD